MKKQRIKTLSLNKKKISNLEEMNKVIGKGSQSWWWSDTKFMHCAPPPDPRPPEPCLLYTSPSPRD